MKQRKTDFETIPDLVQKEMMVKKISEYRAILMAAPDDPSTHHNFAILLRKLNRVDEAIEQSRIAYDLSPSNPKIVLSLGLSLEYGGFFKEAENKYKECLLLNPTYAAALNNLGRLLEHVGRSHEAFAILNNAHELHPLDNNISLNLANVFLSLGKPSETEMLIRNHESATAFNSLGIAKYIKRDWQSAEKLFRIALKIDPNFAGAHENLALTLFHIGDFNSGWDEYDWRWKNTDNQLTKINLKGPIWDGEGLKGKTLLLYSEQGFGDTIQFVRFAGLIKKSKGKILLVCHTKLTDLLRFAPGIDEVLSFDDKVPYFDYHASLVNAARYNWFIEYKFPSIQSYLNVSNRNTKSKSSNNTKSKSSSKKLKIGICWFGRPKHVDDPHRNRSCPVEQFEKLAQLTNVELYNLQLEKPPQSFRIGLNLIEPPERIYSFKDTAEVITTLDIVVSIDTAVIHLTGAMGKPGIVLLSYAADWRWGDGYGEAPWYPSIYMIRQDKPGEWEPVFEKASTRIKSSYLF